MDARQRAVPAPQIKVVIHRALRRQVLGHRRPLAARRQHVEKPVQNLTDINPAPPPAALGRRDQRLHKRELLILQIARIAHCPALVTLPVLTRPHGGSLLAKPRRPLTIVTDSCDSKTSRMDTKPSTFKAAVKVIDLVALLLYPRDSHLAQSSPSSARALASYAALSSAVNVSPQRPFVPLLIKVLPPPFHMAPPRGAILSACAFM